MARDQESIDIGAPGGFRLGIKGTSQQVLIVLLVVFMSCALAYMLWQHDQGTSARQAETVAAWKEVKGALHEVKETQTAMIYVLTLPEKDRTKLNLSKPKSLRDMERE